MKKFFYILIATILTACGGSSIPEDVTYELISEYPNEKLSKSNIEVRLNKKVDESILKEIAFEIRESRTQYEKLWIFYLLPDMNSGSSAWATTHFTPDLKIDILGSTEAQEKVTAQTTDIDGEIIGKWRSEKSLMGGSLILYKDTVGQLMMRLAFKDGTFMTSEIKEEKENNKVSYQDDNSHGEFYVLESNGNLGMYGKEGKFDEAIKF